MAVGLRRAQNKGVPSTPEYHVCMRLPGLAAALLPFALLLPAEPVRLIFDTDMGNDVDDALALAMIHALESRGEARLLAVTLTKDNRYAAPYVDLVNHFYGRGGIPVGAAKNGLTPQDAPMLTGPVEKRDAHGVLVYPRRIPDGKESPEAVGLLRGVLEAQPDGSVVIVQVGFSTNLARLLASPGGRELAARKVRLVSAMAGHFPAPGALRQAEYNVKVDLPAATALFRDWPSPIVVSGWEIGDAMRFPAASILHDFAYVEHHPVADAYRQYRKMPYDRSTYDLTSVLHAVRPSRGYFGVSEAGAISFDAEGKSYFQVTPGGRHRYLSLSGEQRAKTLEALVQLASQPPDHLSRPQ